MKKNKKKNVLFIILIASVAFGLAGIGAWFSVFGLTKIFAAGWSTFILFAMLEIAKLLVVSFVYRFWTITKWFQKFYLIFATVVLMAITSMGIYGYLTAAFQKTSTVEEINKSKVGVLELKKDRFEENRTYYMSEKESIDNSISDLRKGLSNNKIQYTDTLGRIITTTSINTRRVLQAQLDDAIGRRDKISIKLENTTDSLAYYEKKTFEMNSENETSSELGPLIYLSEITELPMSKVINWLTLVIILVVDPLAVMLIVVLNLLLLHSGFDPFEGTQSYKKLKAKEEDDDETEFKEMKSESKIDKTDHKIDKSKKIKFGSEIGEDISKPDESYEFYKRIEDLLVTKNQENVDFKDNIETQIKDIKENIHNKDHNMEDVIKQLSNINNKINQKDDEFKSSVVDEFKKIEEKVRSMSDGMDEILLSKENEDEEFKNEVLSKIEILSEKLMDSSNDDEFKNKVERQIRAIVEKLTDKSDIDMLKNEISLISGEINNLKQKKEEHKKPQVRPQVRSEVKTEKPNNIRKLGSINKAQFYPKK